MAARMPNKITLLVLAILAVLIFVGVWQRGATNAVPTGPRPILEIDREIHDVGRRVSGYTATNHFKFRNTGDKTLIIKKITTSCGCTAVQLDKYEYEPGESGLLQVDVTVRNGKKMMLVYVHTNDPTEKRVTLRLQSEGFQSAIIEPLTFDFSDIRLGNETNRTIKITSGDNRPFKIMDAEIEPIKGIQSSITVVPVEPNEDGRALKWNLTAIINADQYERGNENYRVRLISDHPRLLNFMVPLHVTVRHPLQIEPGPRHFMGIAHPGEKHQTEIILASDDNTPFEILETASQWDQELAMTTESLDNGARHKLTVVANVPSDAEQGFLSARFRIRTNRTDTPEVETSFSIHVISP